MKDEKKSGVKEGAEKHTSRYISRRKVIKTKSDGKRDVTKDREKQEGGEAETSAAINIQITLKTPN